MTGNGNGTATGAGIGTDTLKRIQGIIGSNFADVLTGSATNGSTGNALAPVEVFRGEAGNDTIDGGAGFDFVFYDTSTSGVVVTLGGGAAGTAQDGLGGTDALRNIEGVRGSDFGDTLTGSSWSKVFSGLAGNDVIDGQGGVDNAYYFQSVAGINVDLSQNKASNDGYGSSDVLLNIENVTGSRDFNDSITGNSSDNLLEGNGGNDTLLGGSGQDVLIGGTGDDFLDGGTHDSALGRDVASYEAASGAVQVNLATGRATGADGNDTLTGIETVLGSAYADTLTGDVNGNVLRGNGGNDTIDGGAGFDWADYKEASSSVTVSLVSNTSSGGNGNDTLINIEGIRGGKSNDTLTGDANDNRIRGNGGNDLMEGGAGVDTADYYNATAGVTVNLATGRSSGADGNDTLSNFENISGSFLYGDSLTGSDGNNSIEGLGGDDTLDGGLGTDSAVFSGKYADYTVTTSGSSTTVKDNVGTDGTDTLSNIEQMVFADTVKVVTKQVNVTVSPASLSESGSTNLTYTFTRSGDTNSALSVNFGVDGTASAADYTSNLALASASEPTKAWTKLQGSSGDDYAWALTTGLDGSIYVSGDTDGALDGQTNSGGKDAFLTKYSADGTKAWTKLLGSSGTDWAWALTTGLDGSVYVSGYTTGALDGQTNSGGTDAFLTKYSTDGTKVWTKLLGTSGSDVARSLTTGLDGSIYVSGRTAGALDGQTYSGGTFDAFLIKYSIDGTKVWTKLLGSSGDDFAEALTTGLDGSIYVSGYTTGALNGQTKSGNIDAFLTKYSTDGSKVWTKLLGSDHDVYGEALTTGLDGSIYVSGWTTVALDGQTYSGGNIDAFLTKYSTDGTKAWTKLLGSSGDEGAWGLTTGLDGSIYLSGSTTGSLDGQNNSGLNAPFLTKYSTDGTKASTILLGQLTRNDTAHALTTGLDGSIYVSGATNGAFDGQTNSGGDDAFLTKFSVASPQITFAAGASTATLVLDPTADSVLEGNETVVVTVLAGTGYTLGSTFSATGIIDDTAPTVTTFSPADGATAVAIGANVVVTFRGYQGRHRQPGSDQHRQRCRYPHHQCCGRQSGQFCWFDGDS
jgi:Ca2+-binding RTX toxin-like protein